jgi:hypothetical protein
MYSSEKFPHSYGRRSNLIQNGNLPKRSTNGIDGTQFKYLACSHIKNPMSNKTRSILKAIAVILVLLAIVMQLQWVIIPSISIYKFWLVVLAFGLMLITSK